VPRKSIAPGAARYRAGRGFEWEVRDELTARGYYVVRAARSGGVADLVAVRSVTAHQVLFVQCKRDGRCPPEEWNALYEIAVNHGVIPLVARRQGTRIEFFLLTRLKTRGAASRSPWEPFEP
jgi:Holliday junction resolvase